MLKLEYILIGKLPKTERDMLLENLRTERECGRNVLEWDSAKKHIQEEKRVEGALAKERLAEKVFAEKAILVSGDAKELNEAQRIGMAALCYLMPGDGRAQRKRGSRREDGSDVSGGYVCGKGWRRLTDLFYSMSMRDIIVFRGSF